ncbi:MAG: DUF4199 domain-containing protein [Sphingobacteriaceae bacterium]
MESTTTTPNQYAINNGLIIGSLSVMLNILIYYVSPGSMGSTLFGIVMMLVSLGLYIFFTLDLRKKIGGFWSFREALKGIFLMSFIAGLVVTLVNFIFYKYIEPGAFDKISGIVAANLEQTYAKMGMDQETIDKTMEKVMEGMKSQFNPGFMDLARNFGVAVLIQFVMSMIFAAIFKKEQPIFGSTEE